MATKNQTETAQKIMKDRPQLNEVYLNDKGEFFTEHYLAENSTQSPDGVETIKRLKVVQKATITKEDKADLKSLKDFKSQIEQEQDVEKLNLFLEDEKNNLNRGVVLKLITAKIENLTPKTK